MEILDHWRALRTRFLRDSALLLSEKRDASAALLLCALVDAAGSYYVGRVERAGVEKSFRNFAQRFLPVFARTSFGDLLFDDGKRVRDVIDMLYHCYRNGLVHEGDLPQDVRLVRFKEAGRIYTVNARGEIELDASALFVLVERAADEFERELAVATHVQENYRKRLAYLERARFKKDPAPAIQPSGKGH